jgi:FkbM family methyltransferase
MQYKASENLNTFYTFLGKKFKSKSEVEVIFDIGSCHSLESVEFAKRYKNAEIFAFEANPETYKVCLENTKDYPAISVINKAVNDFDGRCLFYPMDKDRTITTWEDGNQGASSLYRANGTYDHIEKYVQYEIEVPCTRLDTFCESQNIKKVDFIWMDLQGAELKALQSLGSILDTVKIIHTELEINPMYDGQCLFKDVNEYLNCRGFDLEWGNTNAHFGTDFIFVRRY